MTRAKLDDVAILCVNLARAPDRRAQMQVEAARLGLDIGFVDAVDGRSLSDAERAAYDPAARRRTWRAEMTSNEIACVLSHRKALETFLGGDKPFLVLLEDDAVLAEDFADTVAELASAPALWRLVRLETRLADDPGRAVAALPSGRKLVVKRKWTLGGAATLFSRGSAQRFLEGSARFFEAYDNLLGRPGVAGGVIFELDQPVVAERGVESTLETQASRAAPAKKRMRAWWRLTKSLERAAHSFSVRRLR